MVLFSSYWRYPKYRVVPETSGSGSGLGTRWALVSGGGEEWRRKTFRERKILVHGQTEKMSGKGRNLFGEGKCHEGRTHSMHILLSYILITSQRDRLDALSDHGGSGTSCRQ